MPPRLNVAAYRDPVKRCNFRKADWKRFCFLTIKSVERLPPPDTTNIEKAYQEIYESPLSAAKQCFTLSRGKNYVPCWDNMEGDAPSYEPQWGLTLTEPPRPYFTTRR